MLHCCEKNNFMFVSLLRFPDVVKNKMCYSAIYSWIGSLDCLGRGFYKPPDSFLLIFTGFKIEIIQNNNSLEVYFVFHQEIQHVLLKLN